MSLALSIGAKDVVSDVLAGISIVFEGAYNVGDIVDIEGCRGIVQEVGVRSTKLLDDDGNIVMLSNGSIKNIVNLTRHNSWCASEILVDFSMDVAELQKIFDQELPLIGKRIPNIISGPYYRGVNNFSDTPTKSGMSLIFVAECREADVKNVRRALNSEIRMLCEKYQIKQL